VSILEPLLRLDLKWVPMIYPFFLFRKKTLFCARANHVIVPRPRNDLYCPFLLIYHQSRADKARTTES